MGTWFIIVTLDYAGLNMRLSAMPTTITMFGLLSDKLKEEANTNCGQILQTTLQGNGISDWNAVAGMITYYDINEAEGEMSVSDLPGAEASDNWGWGNRTLWGVESGIEKQIGTRPIAFRLGTNVVLTGGFYFQSTPGGLATTTTAQREDTVWHEFWHVSTGMGDIDLVRHYIDPNFAGTVGDASDKFDNWLKAGCPKQ